MDLEQHTSTAEMIDRLQHLLRAGGDDSDFSMPSMLKDVPSFTSSETTAPSQGEHRIGELAGRSY